MAVETVSAQSGEIVTLEEVKQHLGIWDNTQDAQAQLLLESARDFCERYAEVTLRLSATRTYATDSWPSDGWLIKHPPVTAVTHIKYYDSSNVLQTLNASNYEVQLTEAGFAVISYSATATLPTLYDRTGAVIVTYAAGYASAAVAPAAAKSAILLMCRALMDIDDLRTSERSEQAAMTLLATVAAPTYA